MSAVVGARAEGNVQQWLGVSGGTTDEIRKELAFCIEGIDAIAESAILKGGYRRKEYHARDRAAVDRNAFLEDAVKLRRDILCRPGNKATATSAWWVAAKETLSRYELVRYPRPSDVSEGFRP